MTSIDTFLDSFENPEDYIFFKSNTELLYSTVKEGEYIIILKTSHPDFEIKENDDIIYINEEGDLAYSKIRYSTSLGSTKKYYTAKGNNKINFNPIYESQIVGKIIKIVDNNLWNSISINMWDISIHQLNVNALITDN